LFEIGRDTIFRWKRLDEVGKLSPKKSWGTWKKIDPEELRKHVREKNDKTLEDRSKELGASASGIWRALKRLKITCKKNSRSIWKETKCNAGFSGRKSKA
jgi:transposase